MYLLTETSNKMSIPTFRVVQEAGEPLGLFFRPGREDHTVVKQLLSEGRVGMSGVVLDPCHSEFQKSLRTEMFQRNLDVVLDTGMMELATPAGHTAARQQLPWAGEEPHQLRIFDSKTCARFAEQIAGFVAEKRFTVVLAPTHYLAEGAKDPWLATDRLLLRELRNRLDANGCGNVPIHYPLAIPTQVLMEPAVRTAMKIYLGTLPIDAIWLRIHPFGSDHGDTTLRRYIAGCQDLHGLGIPLVAEKTGVLGLALMAFGAVAGVESGISSGERFDFNRFKKKVPHSKHFGRPARIYVAELGLFLTRDQAKQFFDQRGLRQFACRDTECCHRGCDSMLENPRRHFAFTRMGEIAQLSRVTPSLRATEYLDRLLRPATDKIGRALQNDQLPDEIKAKLAKQRRKQDGWRATLGEMSRFSAGSFSVPIERRIRREHAIA